MIKNLKPENTSMLVIDVQERLLKIMDPEITQRTTTAINLCTRQLRTWQVPIIVTEQYSKGLGPTYGPVREHLAGIAVIEKMTFSCYGAAAFRQALDLENRPNIIVTGMETHVCVLQTAQDLVAAGYKVIVLEDAVQSSNKQRYRNGLHLMERAGVVLANSETILFQMLERCDTEEFKHFQKLLKDRPS